MQNFRLVKLGLHWALALAPKEKLKAAFWQDALLMESTVSTKAAASCLKQRWESEQALCCLRAAEAAGRYLLVAVEWCTLRSGMP